MTETLDRILAVAKIHAHDAPDPDASPNPERTMTSPLDPADSYDDVPEIDDAEPADANIDHDGPGAIHDNPPDPDADVLDPEGDA